MESDTLKCQKLEIVDQNGKCRMILTADADKSMILFMREKNPTIQIVASNGNPAQIDFIDVNGVPCLSLGLYDNGDSGLTIRDSKGRPRSITGYNHASDKMIRWDDESLK